MEGSKTVFATENHSLQVKRTYIQLDRLNSTKENTWANTSRGMSSMTHVERKVHPWQTSDEFRVKYRSAVPLLFIDDDFFFVWPETVPCSLLSFVASRQLFERPNDSLSQQVHKLLSYEGFCWFRFGWWFCAGRASLAVVGNQSSAEITTLFSQSASVLADISCTKVIKPWSRSTAEISVLLTAALGEWSGCLGNRDREVTFFAKVLQKRKNSRPVQFYFFSMELSMPLQPLHLPEEEQKYSGSSGVDATVRWFSDRRKAKKRKKTLSFQGKNAPVLANTEQTRVADVHMVCAPLYAVKNNVLQIFPCVVVSALTPVKSVRVFLYRIGNKWFLVVGTTNLRPLRHRNGWKRNAATGRNNWSDHTRTIVGLRSAASQRFGQQLSSASCNLIIC